MRRFNEFSALWKAPMFSRELYVDVGTQWRGIGLRYLLMLLVVTWAALLIQWTVGLSNFLATDAPAAVKDFPPMKVEKGVVSSDVPQPYIMRDEKGQPVFVLDTTGQTKKPSEVGARLLVTRDEVVQEDNGFVQRRPLTAFPDMTVDSGTVLGWIRAVRNGMIPVGLPVLTFFSLAWRMLVSLIFALIGLAVNAAMGGKLTFGGLYRIAVVATTTVVLLDTVLMLVHVGLGCFEWLLFPAITLMYVIVGVRAAVVASRPAAVVEAVPPGETTYFP